MIFCNINNDISIYPKAVQRGIEYLRNTNIMDLKAGKYFIEEDDMFAVVSDMQTAEFDSIKPEIHKEYLDLQYWPEEGEIFGIACMQGNENIVEEYPENDVWYLRDLDKENKILTHKGEFAIFFPNDIHRPGGQIGNSKVIHKCVVKIRVGLL